VVEQSPVARRFVVPIIGRRTVDRSGDGTAPFELEPVDAHTEVVAVREGSGAGWEDVAAAMGAPWVAPVMVDSRHVESYPTGEVTVRFAERPSDAELRDLERVADVRVVRRNEYVDSQVSVAPAGTAGVYLPDLCAQIQERDGVATAWLSTRSRYTKA
jgi:hypothetical protein